MLILYPLIDGSCRCIVGLETSRAEAEWYSDWDGTFHGMADLNAVTSLSKDSTDHEPSSATLRKWPSRSFTSIGYHGVWITGSAQPPMNAHDRFGLEVARTLRAWNATFAFQQAVLCHTIVEEATSITGARKETWNKSCSRSNPRLNRVVFDTA